MKSYLEMDFFPNWYQYNCLAGRISVVLVNWLEWRVQGYLLVRLQNVRVGLTVSFPSTS